MKSKVSSILQKEQFGVLTTISIKFPHMSKVAFVHDKDLKSIYFITPSRTRKYDNIMLNNNVALFLDNAKKMSADICNSIGITAKGTAIALEEHECIEALEKFIIKYPDLREFAKAENSVMFKLHIDRYEIVEKFKHVSSLKADDL